MLNTVRRSATADLVLDRECASLTHMTRAFVAKAPPLVANEDGVIRVAGTRVQLETIVVAFDAGATAEDVAQQYASLELADVYSVISYLLDNEASVRD
jgi:uncharacterized protein (DUF433 family)